MQHTEATSITDAVRSAREFGVCMFTTISEEGALDSRPMKVIAAEEEGSLWFFASASSALVRAISLDGRVSLAFHSGRSWLSVTGDAEIVNDHQAREHYWKLKDESFIAKHPHDPHLVLLRFRALGASAWGLQPPTAARLARGEAQWVGMR